MFVYIIIIRTEYEDMYVICINKGNTIFKKYIVYIVESFTIENLVRIDW